LAARYYGCEFGLSVEDCRRRKGSDNQQQPLSLLTDSAHPSTATLPGAVVGNNVTQ
jgi:hypothetical protein